MGLFMYLWAPFSNNSEPGGHCYSHYYLYGKFVSLTVIPIFILIHTLPPIIILIVVVIDILIATITVILIVIAITILTVIPTVSETIKQQ